MRVVVPISAPIRDAATWDERWKGPDQGLIAAWEAGRKKAAVDPDLAQRAGQGELVVLPWKGGVDEPVKAGWKYGALHYLAMWKGLRGEDLDLTRGEQVEVVCSRTQMRVVFTDDVAVLMRA